MHKLGKTLALVGCGLFLLLVIVAISLGRPDYGPVYNGKNLSEWVTLLSKRGPELEIESAIVDIGPPALPYLVKWIQYNQASSKQNLIYAINEVRLKVGGPFFGLTVDEQDIRAAGAYQAFRLLAPLTTNAFNELVTVARASAQNRKEYKTTIRACFGLQQFGSQAVPVLIELLTSQQIRVAATTLGDMGTNAFPAVPALIQSLSSKEPSLPPAAAEALGKLQHAPDLAVPALIACLTSTNRSTRSFATDALAKFGTNSLIAIPAIRPLIADPDEFVRQSATNFLSQLAPEALAKSPVQ